MYVSGGDTEWDSLSDGDCVVETITHDTKLTSNDKNMLIDYVS